MIESDQRFLGRGWAFPPRFDDGSVQMVEAGDDIDQSLQVLLCTTQGERLMRPDFGLGVQAHVFDLTDETALTELAFRIEESIRFHEPRIVLENLDVTPHADLDGHLNIAITYRVVATNSRANVVFPFYMQEGTSVRDL